MLVRELTEKQEAFALARAMSKSWVDSYRQAYRPSDPRAVSCYNNAYRLRSNPRVVERIEELRAQLKPAPDADTLHRKMLQAAIDLLETGGDDKARAVAFEWAVAEIERMRKIEAGERKVAEARERAEERAKFPAKATAVEEPGETPARGESEEEVEETGERVPGEVEAPEPLINQKPRYRMVDVPLSPPGHFPQRFARRLVSY